VSLSHETLLELMAFADGELEGAAKSRIEDLIASNAEARAVVAGFRAPDLAHALADSVDRRADAAGADQVATTVLARLGLAAPPASPISISSRLHGRAARARRAAVVVGGALALAAAVVLILRVSHVGFGGGSLGEARVGAPSVEWAPSRDIPPSASPRDVHLEVRSIDAPAAGAEVFELPVAGGPALPATAPSHPAASVTVIRATRAGESPSVDPALGDLRALMQRPRFSSFDTYRLVDRRELLLSPERAAIAPLPGGRTLRVTLGEPLRTSGADRRVHLVASIDSPGAPPFVRSLDVMAPAETPFVIAGLPLDDAAIAVEVRVHDDRAIAP
jgi:hypothetical protein